MQGKRASWAAAIAPVVMMVPVLIGGCGARRYEALPLSPEASAAALKSRSLADPGLRAYEESALGTSSTEWPPSSWNFQSLSLAALYFSTDLDAARARLDVSRAAVTTAGARPNPTFGVTPGVPSPYLLTLDLSFPIETSGKRRYRLEAARHSARAAELDVAQAAWAVRGAVRAALVDELVFARTLDLLRAEAKTREEQVALLDRMAAIGEITRLQADGARLELSKTRSALAAAEEQVVESRAALAAAIGIPATALRDVQLSWPDMSEPPAATSLPVEEIRREAVLNRLDVRGALERYAAAESDLRLQIAKQYPDLDIGPGYTYEEKQSYFTLGFSAAIPMFDRNQGPIAEAEARRREAAAAFLSTQAEVIAASERSLAVYGAALGELEEAARFEALTEKRRRGVEESVRAGEQGHLELDDASIEQLLASRTELESLARVQRALGDLENAVERPLTAADRLPAGATVETLGSKPVSRGESAASRP